MSVEPTDEEEELFPEVESEVSVDGNKSPAPADEETVERASKAARKLEPIVLAHVLGPNYQPVKPRVIAKQLKLPSEQHKALKLAIKRLAKAGKVLYGAGHLVRPPQRSKAQGPKSKVQSPEVEVRSRRSEVSESAPRNRDSKNVVIGTF